MNLVQEQIGLVENEDLYKGLVQHLESLRQWIESDPDKVKNFYLRHRDTVDIKILGERRLVIEEAIRKLKNDREVLERHGLDISPHSPSTSVDQRLSVDQRDLDLEVEVLDFLIKANANRKDIQGDFRTRLEKLRDRSQGRE